MGSTTGLDGLQLAGSLAMQSTPDVSGDVPAFSALAPEVIRSGSIGGAGFRPDAIHLVILATDQCPVAPFDPGLGIPAELQGSGATVPITEFACSSIEPGDNRFGFTSDVKTKGDNDPRVAPAGAARVPAVIEALNAARIGVIGAFPTVEGSDPRSGPILGPTFGPDAFLNALARLTGTVDSAGTPLVFDVDDIGPVLRNAVIDAISAAASRPVDVRLSPSGALPAGLQLTLAAAAVGGVRPGEQACFDLTLAGSGQPQGAFSLQFQAGDRALGSIPVTVSCTARCGDGTVDAFLGEQCDAGGANGAAGSCCDAACHLMAAATVCRQAGAACDVPAMCDGVSAACPESASRSDGTLCDDGDAATGTSACVSAACRGVEVGVDVLSDVAASQDPVRIPVVLDVADGLEHVTTVRLQAFVSCDDRPALESCTTRACRQLEQQLATFCPASTSGVTSARKAHSPAGLLPVTKQTSRKLKRSRRGQVSVRLALNKTGRGLLAQSTPLPVHVLVDVSERGGATLNARFETLLRR